MRCHACEARDAAASRWSKDDNATSHGIYFAVRPDHDDFDDPDGGD